jgi:site-specific DNA recombinase
VIVAKLDRLTRSVKDLCGLLELFEKRKVALISVAEALDTGSAAGRLVITIMGAFSQWEREALGERTRDALQHKRSNGERVGNIEFGFRLSADLRHLEPDPTEQAALAEIRNLRRQGHTLRGIAAKLNKSGHRTRRPLEREIARRKRLAFYLPEVGVLDPTPSSSWTEMFALNLIPSFGA